MFGSKISVDGELLKRCKAHASAAAFLSGDASQLKYTDEELKQMLSARNFVDVRQTPGGPAPGETARALDASRHLLQRDGAWLDGVRKKLDDAAADRRRRVQML